MIVLSHEMIPLIQNCFAADFRNSNNFDVQHDDDYETCGHDDRDNHDDAHDEQLMNLSLGFSMNIQLLQSK